MEAVLWKKEIYRKWFERGFLYFILVQPLLDVSAFFHLPVSEYIRVLAMIIGLSYIWVLPTSPWRKKVLLYLSILGCFMVLYLIVPFIEKGFHISMAEITYVTKTGYFFVILAVYTFVFQSLMKNPNWERRIQRIVYIAMASIGIVMLLATFTNTGKSTYGSLQKAGHTGWFFSGNELSVILAIGFGIMILYMMQTSTTLKKVLSIPMICLVIWSMLTVGTKVSFGALMMILTFSAIISIVMAIRKKSRWVNTVILIPLLFVSLIITPITPIGTNLGVFFGTSVEQPMDTGEGKESLTSDIPLLSGRKDFLINTFHQYQDAPLNQKLIGLGISNETKLIEMDMLDWIFNFGIIGFLILMIPFIYLMYHIIKFIVQQQDNKINLSILLVGQAVLLGLGSSIIAGHVLSSPAASIYLAIVWSYFLMLTRSHQHFHKGHV